MKLRVVLLLLALVSAAGHAQVARPPSVTAPSDEAPPRRLNEAESEVARAAAPYRRFSVWLDAFNAPDVSRLREFGVQFCSGCASDAILRVRDRGGVLDLRALEESTATSVTGVVQSRDSEIFWRFTMVFGPAESLRVKKFPFNRIPRPADFPLPRLTQKEIFAALDMRLADLSAADKFAGVVLVTKHRKTHRLELRTHGDYVRLFRDRGPAFEPGSRFEYSNYGPVLLGVVIERVTGQSYFDYVARHVYKTAGMTRTGTDPMEALLPNTAIGYTRAPGGGRKPNWAMLSYRGSAGGGGYSSARDLAKYADALLANKLLDAANTALLIAGKVERPDGGKYAFGFDDKREGGKGYVGHGGAAPGVSSLLMVYPDSGYVAVVLANVDPPIALDIGNFVGLRLDNQRGGADR